MASPPRQSSAPDGLPVATDDFSRFAFTAPGERSFQGYVAGVDRAEHESGAYTIERWLSRNTEQKLRSAYEGYVITNFLDGSSLRSIAGRLVSVCAAVDIADRAEHDCYRVIFFGPNAERVLAEARYAPNDSELNSVTAMSAVLQTRDHLLLETLHRQIVAEVERGSEIGTAFQHLLEAAAKHGVPCAVSRGLNPNFKIASDRRAE